MMFLFIVTGIIAKKKNVIKTSSANDMSVFITRFIVPFIVVNALQLQVTPSKVKGFVFAVILGFVAHIFGIVLSYLIIRKKPDFDKDNLERLCCVTGNASFMSFPLIQSVMGDQALLYGAAFLISFHVTLWTWGLKTLDGKKFNLKRFISQPPVIGIILGSILFLFSITIPGILGTWVGRMSGLSSPISMIIFGVYIADTNIKRTISNLRIYRVTMVKNILIPLAMIFLISVFKLHNLIDNGVMVAKTIIISSSAACGITPVLLAASNNKDSNYTSELVAMSTIFAIITIPAMVYISEILIK